MEEAGRKVGEYKKIAELYLEHLAIYRRQLGLDSDLPTSSQQKMRELVDDFLVELEDYLTRVAKFQKLLVQVEQGLVAPEQNDERQPELLRDELNSLADRFERLAGTTPKLMEIKRRLDDKLRFIDSATDLVPPIKKPSPSLFPVASRGGASKSFAASKPVDANEKWLDSLMSDITKKNEKLRLFEEYSGGKSAAPVASIPQSEAKSSAAGFRMIRDELQALKTTVKQLKEETRTHRHDEIEKQVDRLGTEAIKIETDNKVIQREHSELLHTLHLLAKRVDILERENTEIRSLIKGATGRQGEAREGRSSEKLSASARKEEEARLEPRTDPDVSGWVLERLRKAK